MSSVPFGAVFDQPGLSAAVLGVWALGIAAIAVRRGASRRYLHSLLSRTCEIGDGEVRALLARCRETIGVRRYGRLLESPALAAPALWPGGPSSAPGSAPLKARAARLPLRDWSAWRNTHTCSEGESR